jgi:hypothetical protein
MWVRAHVSEGDGQRGREICVGAMEEVRRDEVRRGQGEERRTRRGLGSW